MSRDITNLIIAALAFSVITNWPWGQLEIKWRAWRDQSELQKPSRHYAWQVFVICATILGFLAVIDQFWGRPWATDPEIHPHDHSVVNSSLVLPFTIRNRSLFPMNNVAITCGVDLVAFGDADGHWGGAAGIAFYTGTISIPGNSLINYPCDASSLVQVRPDGTFGLRDTLSSKGTPFQSPLKILKMCIWILAGVPKVGPESQSFTSIIFKWPATQTNRQWIEGPTAVEPRPTEADAIQQF